MMTAAWLRRRWAVLLAALFILAGLAWTGMRIHWQQTPLLPANVGRTVVEGRVERIRFQRPGWARMVLDVQRVEGVRKPYWPARVRLNVSLKGANAALLPLPGEVVRLRATLLRLPRPQEPGAFDPARDLYMAGIGAVGFARAQDIRVRVAGCADCGPWLQLVRWLERLRRGIAARVRAAMHDERAAALALALVTGERGALPEKVRENLRAAGLAHVLAISGLHMALVAGAVFWLVRAVLAAFPALALRWPLKKMAAVAAWLVALAYLLLSGNSVATQRAFIMLSVALLALLLDRPAISMRNLAVAAWIIMLLSPHKVVSAGFQMSFMAVAGLVAA
jgi:competence protein ComEC